MFLFLIKYKNIYFTINELNFFKINFPIWLFFSILGLIQNENYITFFAFVIGFTLILPICIFIYRDKLSEIVVFIKILLILLLLLFFLQYFTFYYTGTVINYHNSIYLASSRTFNSDLNFFRPSAIAQEPSEYSRMVFMLLSLLYSIEGLKFNLLSVLTFVSVFLCESLWGIGGLFVLIFVFSKIKLLIKVVITSLGFFIFNIVGELNFLTKFIFSDISQQRVENIDSDASAIDRLGLQNESFLSVTSFFGNGLTTSLFQNNFGANTFSFYIYSFGLFSLFVFLFSFLSFGLTIKTIRFYFILFYFFLAFPIFTYFVTWNWIAINILIMSANINLDKK
jgi:hypothetical protein